jgi:Protein of unknown function (DUF1353)
MWPKPPYYASDDSEPRFVLRQVTDTSFELTEAFIYRPGPREEQILVDSTALPTTDLASIPWFVSWFVSRHGRHTPAALVHDSLVYKARKENDIARRAAADLVFRDALDELSVPPVRGRIMWAAVTLGTRWHRGLGHKIALVIWMIAAAVGTWAVLRGVWTGQLDLILAGTVAPVLGAVLWGRQYSAGLVASYALFFIGLPVLTCVIGYGVYWVIEQAVRLLRKPLKHNRGRPLPGPTPFGQVFAVPAKGGPQMR